MQKILENSRCATEQIVSSARDTLVDCDERNFSYGNILRRDVYADSSL